MEFKVSKKKSELETVAEDALAQIKERDYIHKFESGTPILCIGISFYKKHMRAKSVVLESIKP